MSEIFYNAKIDWKNEHVFSLNVYLCTFGVDFNSELWTYVY